MKLLITGASGFTGRHFLKEINRISECSLEIFCLYQSHEPEFYRNFSNIQCDLTVFRNISRIIEEIRPEMIIHLAALNKGSLKELLTQNVVSTENLFEAIHQAELFPRVLAVGSSAEYGYQGNSPINETAPIRPMSLYGVSKAAASHLILLYHRKYNIPTAIVRPFNLIGPGQSESFVVGKILYQMGQFDRNEIDLIQLKNVDSERDFIDVRDAVKAYISILLHRDFNSACAGKIFNVGSGKSYSILRIFRMIEEHLGKNYPFEIIQPSEEELIPGQVCNSAFLHSKTGWRPSIPIKDSLKDIIQHLYQEPSNQVNLLKK